MDCLKVVGLQRNCPIHLLDESFLHQFCVKAEIKLQSSIYKSKCPVETISRQSLEKSHKQWIRV